MQIEHTNIFERIKEVSKMYGYSSINKFALDGLGFNSSEKINRLKDPAKKPSFDLITSINDKFPEVDMNWLIGGVKTKYGEIKNETAKVAEPNAIFESKVDSKVQHQKIPLYDTEAVAGIVPVFEDLSDTEPSDYLQIPNAPKCDGAIFANGDSMYPIVKSGDILCYKEIKDLQNDIFWGQIYILYIEVAGDNLRTVKYIHRGSTVDTLKLVSENRHHEEKEIKINKVIALAQVKVTVRIN